jgi:hypothetical protein
MAAIGRAQSESLKLAANELASLLPNPVEVQVQFRDNARPIDVARTAHDLAKFIAAKAKDIDDSRNWAFHQTGLRDIEMITLRLHTSNGVQWLKQTRVGPIYLNWVTVDPIHLIQEVIDSKQLKLPQYLKKCDECWLLIGVNEWAASEAFTLTGQGVAHAFNARFSRLFFIRNGEEAISELQVA